MTVRSEAVASPGAGHDDQISSPHLPGLTVVRGLAAIAVVLFHAYAIASYPAGGSIGAYDLLASGYLAVDVFFILSGCVLFLPIARRSGSSGPYGRFLLRRITRLWPCYALTLTAATLLHAAQGIPTSQLPPANGGVLPIVSHVVMLPTATGLQHLGFGLAAIYWTISVETCFSLLLPLVARWWFRHPFTGLAATLAFSRVWVFVCTHVGPGAADLLHPSVTNSHYLGGANLLLEFPTYAGHFGVGMTLAWTYIRYGDVLRERLAGLDGLLVCLGGTGVLAVAMVLGRTNVHELGSYGQWGSTWPILFPVPVLLLGAMLAQGRTAKILHHPVLQFVGDVSYPLYLVHSVIMRIVSYQHEGAGWDHFAVSLATVPGSLLLAYLLHRFVEVPAADWGKRAAARPRVSPSRLALP